LKNIRLIKNYLKSRGEKFESFSMTGRASYIYILKEIGHKFDGRNVDFFSETRIL